MRSVIFFELLLSKTSSQCKSELCFSVLWWAEDTKNVKSTQFFFDWLPCLSVIYQVGGRFRILLRGTAEVNWNSWCEHIAVYRITIKINLITATSNCSVHTEINTATTWWREWCTHSWVVPAESLLPDGQGVIQQVGCLFVFVLISDRQKQTESEQQTVAWRKKPEVTADYF